MTTAGRPIDGSSERLDRPALVLRGLEKSFGDVPAVDGVDLEVRQGEFITLLGPSGSGKTTTLRMIAGFTRQSAGTIEIDGADMSQVPPYRRDVGMIFQNYALFPHMTAAENIAFPLEMRRASRSEIRRRVAEALALVKLEGFGGRYPRQLSGGQQQRIAFARAVVFHPRLLLMDEPLGALDKKLREALQLEVMHISRQLGATVIYVTHDQEEALVMSDRIAIFNRGRIEQLGRGEDLYDRPVSLFVADFIGDSNILRGWFERDGDGGWLVRDASRWRVGAAATARAALDGDRAAALVVRPERLRIVDPGDAGAAAAGANTVEASVRDVLYLGSIRKYELTLPDEQTATVRQQVGGNERVWQPGARVRLTWAVDDEVLVSDPGGRPSRPGDVPTAPLA
ncbi:MAG: polyamine ABC transporter ATP-binding protein [Anaerolinea sp.]|nr:polyamine ABC transporter ATP-binding protein [Anaerolinea sp.]